MSDPRLDLVPDPDELRNLLAAPGGSGIALIEVPGEDPFYVGLNKDIELEIVE